MKDYLAAAEGLQLQEEREDKGRYDNAQDGDLWLSRIWGQEEGPQPAKGALIFSVLIHPSRWDQGDLSKLRWVPDTSPLRFSCPPYPEKI